MRHAWRPSARRDAAIKGAAPRASILTAPTKSGADSGAEDTGGGASQGKPRVREFSNRDGAYRTANHPGMHTLDSRMQIECHLAVGRRARVQGGEVR